MSFARLSVRLSFSTGLVGRHTSRTYLSVSYENDVDDNA